MVQVLHISNGDTMNHKLAAKGNRLEAMLSANWSNDQLIDEAYQSALCRLPSDAERARLAAALADVPAAERRSAVEDLYWSVLSSKEFLFNH